MRTSRENAEVYFEFLDRLRKGAELNMFGARPVLMEEFGLDGALASAVLAGWMETFDPDVSAQDRAKEAFAE